MNLLLRRLFPLLLIWVCCFSLLSVLSDARPEPWFSSISEPALPTGNGPIPPIDAKMAALAPGAQVERIEQHENLDRKMLAAVIASTAVFVAILVAIFGLCIYQHNKWQNSDPKNIQSSGTDRGLALGPVLGKLNSLRITGKKGLVSVIEYQLLEAATNNFRESNVLGEGGFGCVYKARFNDNLLAAVKRLDCSGQDAEKEFENEVDLLNRIRHPNIISLLGYCINGETRFIIYELMHNGSLETQLHGPSRGSALTWHIRMKIALDAARGLEYLHEHCNPPVIHRDLKSSNILLDSYFNAKISDFGLAVAGGAQNKNSIKLSGTLGYVAPEYLLDGKLTEKSDVYAFGVVLLELLMGRKPVEKMAPSQCQSIVTWAMPQLTDRSKLPNIVDPVIRNTMDLKHLYQVAAVAVLCVQPEPSYRPLITDVLHSLIPLVPVELGGTLRLTEAARSVSSNPSAN
ncbi:probable receptor-like protein kinase At1g80640 isoform X2 [Telopea speciosissima]|uniref:probable receptor-like protein kinase At1g80640 isoform X2 n=1 Tax=Telopea speciosissima TaxID=54955 RepID=UPI001CC3F5D2|nr:probable receptor-like protein kinase At1g80640 isoform X2 [Telopea speciosissima]